MTENILSLIARPAEDVLFQEVSGEVVLLDLKSEQYFGLDEVGTRIWLLINEHQRLQEVFDQLLEEFNVDKETLRKDLEQHVKELEERKLIEIEMNELSR